MKPQKIDTATLAFPTAVEGTLLPAWADIPDEFRGDRGRSNPWCSVVMEWFNNGLNPVRFKAKDGIDSNDAWRHLGACLKSRQPKHEHKVAGVAYLMSQWFDMAAPSTEQTNSHP